MSEKSRIGEIIQNTLDTDPSRHQDALIMIKKWPPGWLKNFLLKIVRAKIDSDDAKYQL